MFAYYVRLAAISIRKNAVMSALMVWRGDARHRRLHDLRQHHLRALEGSDPRQERRAVRGAAGHLEPRQSLPPGRHAADPADVSGRHRLDAGPVLGRTAGVPPGGHGAHGIRRRTRGRRRAAVRCRRARRLRRLLRDVRRAVPLRPRLGRRSRCGTGTSGRAFARHQRALVRRRELRGPQRAAERQDLPCRWRAGQLAADAEVLRLERRRDRRSGGHLRSVQLDGGTAPAAPRQHQLLEATPRRRPGGVSGIRVHLDPVLGRIAERSREAPLPGVPGQLRQRTEAPWPLFHARSTTACGMSTNGWTTEWRARSRRRCCSPWA